MERTRMQAPLKVEIKDDKLVISLGIGTLAHAAEMSDTFNPYNMERGDWFPLWNITDALEWAKDVKRAMLDESEDGSSPLTRFLDKMDEAALCDGSTAVEEIPLPPIEAEED